MLTIALDHPWHAAKRGWGMLKPWAQAFVAAAATAVFTLAAVAIVGGVQMYREIGVIGVYVETGRAESAQRDAELRQDMLNLSNRVSAHERARHGQPMEH